MAREIDVWRIESGVILVLTGRLAWKSSLRYKSIDGKLCLNKRKWLVVWRVRDIAPLASRARYVLQGPTLRLALHRTVETFATIRTKFNCWCKTFVINIRVHRTSYEILKYNAQSSKLEFPETCSKDSKSI